MDVDVVFDIDDVRIDGVLILFYLSNVVIDFHFAHLQSLRSDWVTLGTETRKSVSSLYSALNWLSSPTWFVAVLMCWAQVWIELSTTASKGVV
jgi:hypothetical protein